MGEAFHLAYSDNVFTSVAQNMCAAVTAEDPGECVVHTFSATAN